MKRKTTREILAESFRELAGKKNIDRITIRDITENSGYSTATFYRHFRDKYDLIAWDYTRRAEGILARLGEDGVSWRQVLCDAMRDIQKQREYLANLFLHTSGLDSFLSHMREANFDCLKQTVLRVSGLRALDDRTERLIRIYVLGSVQMTCEWILGTCRASPEELAEICDVVLPEPLRPYLCGE